MIRYFDYRPEYARLKREIDEAIARVIASGRLILGPEVEAFEREMAAQVGVDHAVGVNSGTDALILALRALDLEPDAEVISVANAGVPPVAAIRAAGAQPRLVDVDPDSLLIDPSTLERARSARTRCILAVHLYGQPAPLEPILRFAATHGLHVVEDCAQAHGATYDGKPVGGFGAIGCFSFYPTKNVGALGDGGMCVTHDPALAERLRMLRMYGFRDNERHAHCEGLNSRLDELQAAVLRTKLRVLDETIAERRRLAALYGEQLHGCSAKPTLSHPRGRHTYHLFVVRTPHRAEVVAAFERERIGYGIHYAEPVHRMKGYAFLRSPTGALAVSEAACREVLSLPLYPGLPDQAVERVVRTLRDASA